MACGRSLSQQGLDRVAVAVTRWYGGQAGCGRPGARLRGAADACLRTSSRVSLVETVDAAICVAFTDIGAVHAALARDGAQKTAEAFEAGGAVLRVWVAEAALDDLKSPLRDATRERASVRRA